MVWMYDRFIFLIGSEVVSACVLFPEVMVTDLLMKED